MTPPRREAQRAEPFIRAGQHALVEEAARALRAGEVVAIPTDTVYGFAAGVDRPEAISRLYALKGRASEKAIPVLLSDSSQLKQVAVGLSATAALLASAFWPGALTLVVPALPELTPHLTDLSEDGVRGVAVRVPDNRLACAIIAAAGGALAVTSANKSGNTPALDAREAAAVDASRSVLVVDGGRVAEGIPSTIVLCTGSVPRILREGAVSAASVEDVINRAAGCNSLSRYDQSMTQQHRASNRSVTTA